MLYEVITVCIGLWTEVLEFDPNNEAALNALAPLYEHSRQYEELVGVLEKQVEITYDEKPKVQLLTKLGMIYGDRLNNDEGAVEAWRLLSYNFV